MANFRRSVAVTPGQTITIEVGATSGTGGFGTGGHGRAGDNGGYRGGNGGSGSAIVINGSAQIVAGAGGGTGGRSAHQLLTNDVERGGAGGGSAAGINGGSGAGQRSWKSRPGRGGVGPTANGLNGHMAPPKPEGDFGGGGGGGGAVWNGGQGGGAGNGATTDLIGGGGAGSSYTDPNVTSFSVHTGENAGNGYVVIVPVQSVAVPVAFLDNSTGV